MKTALVILFPNFEEIEAVATIDVLRRGNVDVTVASLHGEKNVTGAHKITCMADVVGIPAEDFDALIIPGGPGIAQLRHSEKLEELILRQYEAGRLLAAICAAPLLLQDVGILDKHHHTAHFSLAEELPDARTHELVVSDGNVITGCGPAGGINFGLAILKYLENMESVRGVMHGMMCDHQDTIV
jgi:4-methyl-5(b-hydroxyethyl)-thiazole monophosphate biosynthesis